MRPNTIQKLCFLIYFVFLLHSIVSMKLLFDNKKKDLCILGHAYFLLISLLHFCIIVFSIRVCIVNRTYNVSYESQNTFIVNFQLVLLSI